MQITWSWLELLVNNQYAKPLQALILSANGEVKIFAPFQKIGTQIPGSSEQRIHAMSGGRINKYSKFPLILHNFYAWFPVNWQICYVFRTLVVGLSV